VRITFRLVYIAGCTSEKGPLLLLLMVIISEHHG